MNIKKLSKLIWIPCAIYFYGFWLLTTIVYIPFEGIGIKELTYIFAGVLMIIFFSIWFYRFAIE